MRVDPTNHPKYDLIMSISAAVLEAERDMDKSITTLSRLVSTTIEDFAAHEMPASSSQRALDKLAEAITAHVGTRRLLGEAHREYGRTAKMIGATAEDWGPSWPCPKEITDQPVVSRHLKIAA